MTLAQYSRQSGDFFLTLLRGVAAAVLLSAISCHGVLARAPEGYARASYILPPALGERGTSFAGVVVPLNRQEVATRIVDQINYLLMDRRAVMMEWFDRLAEAGPTIRKVLVSEKVPEDLVYLSILLSGLLPNDTAKTGGVGWWALGSESGQKRSSVHPWVVTNDWDDRRDPVISTRIACTILQSLRRRKHLGDWLMAICAFVDGTDKVTAAAKKAQGFSYWDMVMPNRSEVIIPRLIALKIINGHTDLYGIDVPRPRPLQYDFLDRLKLVKDLPLYVVAGWCDVSPRAMWELNPGVAPSTGILPRPDKRSPSGFPLRVPKGMGPKVSKLLVRQGYLKK